MSTPEEILFIERLVGQRETIAGLEATSAATGRMRSATMSYGAAAESARKRTWGMNQALFTMRRYAYFGTLALTGLFVAGVASGIRFNATMQESRIALVKFMGSTAAVNVELGKLFRIAAFSPFRFSDMTTAFRTMFPAMRGIGMSAADVTQTIQAMVDAMSVAGKSGTGSLNRVATALQHIAYSGRLTGQMVTQLGRDGLPVYQALQKELGLTAEQIHHIGALGIPAMTGIKAITQFIETTPGWEGAARRQSRTFRGAIQTFEDYFSMISGRATHHLFLGLTSDLNRINDAMSSLTNGGLNARLTMQMFVTAADREFTPRFHNIQHVWQAIAATFRVFSSLLRNVLLPALLLGFGIFTTVMLPPLTLLLDILNPLTRHLTLLRIVLGLAFARVFIFGTAALAARTATFLWSRAILGLIGVESLYELKLRIVVYWTALQTLWVNRAALAYNVLRTAVLVSTAVLTISVAMMRRAYLVIRTLLIVNLLTFNRALLVMRLRLLAARAAIAVFIIWTRIAAVATRIWTAAQWLLDIALDANPIGAVILLIGLFALAVYSMSRHLRELRSELRRTWDWLRKPIPGTSWIRHLGTRLHFGLPNFSLTGMAEGGHVVKGGWSVVGERGAELLRLPTGASVVPLSPAGGITAERFGDNRQLTIRVPIYLDGRQISEVVARHNNDWMAAR